jgi:hypothetical protein
LRWCDWGCWGSNLTQTQCAYRGKRNADQAVWGNPSHLLQSSHCFCSSCSQRVLRFILCQKNNFVSGDECQGLVGTQSGRYPKCNFRQCSLKTKPGESKLGDHCDAKELQLPQSSFGPSDEAWSWAMRNGSLQPWLGTAKISQAWPSLPQHSECAYTYIYSRNIEWLLNDMPYNVYMYVLICVHTHYIYIHYLSLSVYICTHTIYFIHI